MIQSHTSASNSSTATPAAVGATLNRLTTAAYIAGLQAAGTIEELEQAIQAPRRPHRYRGRGYAAVAAARHAASEALCAAHALAPYIPQFKDNVLTVFGENRRLGRSRAGSTWQYAGWWAKDVLKQHGLSQRAAYDVWDWWISGYPHRAIAIVEAALAGKIPDPEMDTLKLAHASGGPINYSLEAKANDPVDSRAHQPCACGGTLFDWGGGYDRGFTFISWHCNQCANVFVEYCTDKRFAEIRKPRMPAAA
ncbi:MAG: hypothetical protein BGO50_01495 [Rhodanobacter sp. 67-28]|nr:MAG: hypothetical protein BGO50_01495 [Rhodanobacter sp. 67-28]